MKHKQFLENLIGPLSNQGGGGGTPAVLIDKNISANGTYNASSDNADGYKKVVVAVEPDLQSKSVTIQQNGTTTVSPDQGKDGLSGVEITVNVSGGQQTLDDFAYQIFNQTVTSLADSTDPNVPRVTKMPKNLTREWPSLESIDYPNVTLLDQYSLYACPSLKVARFASCTEIKGYVLASANALETLYLPSMTTMGAGTLSGLAKLKNVNLDSLEAMPNTTFIAPSDVKNYDLTELSLPAMKSVGTSCGQYFAGLTKLTFGSSVTSLGSSAFRYCFALSTVIFGAETAAVPSAGSHIFDGSAIASGHGYIYVPDALVNNWKAASNWSTYANRIKGLSELPS